MVDTQVAIGHSSYSFASNRVSHMLGLAGASLSVDCASASALVAVHMAAAEARQGRACQKLLKMSFNMFLNPLS